MYRTGVHVLFISVVYECWVRGASKSVREWNFISTSALTKQVLFRYSGSFVRLTDISYWFLVLYRDLYPVNASEGVSGLVIPIPFMELGICWPPHL